MNPGGGDQRPRWAAANSDPLNMGGSDQRPRWMATNSGDSLPWLDMRMPNPDVIRMNNHLPNLPASLPMFQRYNQIRQQRFTEFSQTHHRPENHVSNCKTVLSDGVEKYIEKDPNPFYASKRVLKDLEELERVPLTDVHIGPINDNLMQLIAVIEGPSQTPYDGGVFFIDIQIPNNYPFKPPELNFRTRIYHPNINSQGTICLNLLSNDWSPEMTLSKVFEGLISLLYSCNLDDPLVPSIAETYIKDQKEFERIAKQWTQNYSNCNFETQNG